MKHQIARHPFRGMTLVELMVAITIGLIVLAAVSTIFVQSKANYTSQESTARLQESARFAMHFLTRDIRMAGYFGCADDIESINSTLNDVSQATPYDFTTAIVAVEGTTVYPSGTGTIEFPTSGDAVTSLHGDCPAFVGGRCNNTDALAVRFADPSTSVGLATAMPNTSAAAFIDQGSGLQAGDVVLLTDCGSAELFQITSISSNSPGRDGLVHNAGNSGTPPGNSTQKFERAYGPPNASVMRFADNVYYIGTGASGHPSLFRKSFHGTDRIELVEGIEDMEVTFGVDNVGDRTPRLYLPANDGNLGSNKANWANVVSARVALTVRPVIGQVSQDNKKEFVTTVLMRNLQ